MAAIGRATLLALVFSLPLFVPFSARADCAGDCDNDGTVDGVELELGVILLFDDTLVELCPRFDTAPADGRVMAHELLRAFKNFAAGQCPLPTPTPSPTVTLSPTPLEGTTTPSPPGFSPTPSQTRPTNTPSPAGPPVTFLLSSSPRDGEDDVAVTRETVLRFSEPLEPGTVGEASVHATFGGTPLPVRRHLSVGGDVLTLFYTEPLPPSARVRVVVDGSRLRDADGRLVDADGDGEPGGVAVIDFDTLSLAVVPGTAVCGRVFASELEVGDDGGSVNVPLEGVTITVDGMEDELFAVTDQFGDFRLEPAPAGRFFVHIDGRTASENVPPGAYYPFVGKAWESIAGEEVNIGEVFLPLVVAGSLQPVSATEETEIRFPPSVLEQFPDFEDAFLMVPPDSLFSDDGTGGGMVGIAPVPPDRLPGTLPPGLDFPIVITVQTDGATNFDTPVPVCLPNLPDAQTGEPLPPGAKSALWSFNHDTGRFEVVGPMTVTGDGRLVCSDAGVGILAPGWHGTAPGAAGGGGDINGPGGAGAGGDGSGRGTGPDGSNGQEKGGQSPPPAAPSSEDCDGNNADEGDDVVDPVYLFSGEFYTQVEDLRIPGRGLDFVWARKYRSRIGPNTAQGNGWDFSYNVFLDPDGADIIVCDGNSRRDTYRIATGQSRNGGSGRGVIAPGRTWTRREDFRVLTLNEDGTYTMSFAAGGEWDFHPFDESPRQGKIAAIRDRNGNELRFAYDAQGRLATVTDTLDRDIEVAYDADGFIASITDFTGRQVRYEYYRDGEDGGSFGDLKSVRSPVVVDTSNGNDFPDGKLTSYTYSTGFEDDRLNHNLLTVTDPRRNDPNDSTFGQGPYLHNVYAATQDPEDSLFDRVVRQVWGDPGDIVDLSYVPLTPSGSNGNAYTKTIVNDRTGNVVEYFFERGNRVVLRRRHTGRADPDRPTTDTLNRPANPLRADDPPFFETRYEWTEDSRKRRVVYPNGNTEEFLYESDLVVNASPRSRGNLRIRRRRPGPLAAISDQPLIEEGFEYDPSFGCPGCSGQFVTRHTDGRGNVTLYEYDERGNMTQVVRRLPSIVEEFEYNERGQMTARIRPDNGGGHRRRDEYEYYEEGPQRGYLSARIVDAGGLELTTRCEYDAVGNRVRTIDARGNDVLYTVNALDQVVRVLSREVAPGSGLRYRQDRFYDANDNLIRIDVEDIGAGGDATPISPLTTTWEYETLNRPVRRIREVDGERVVVEEYAYDANRNRTLVRFGEAAAGRQPDNVETMLYDERDLVYRVTRGAGDDASTMQRDYDGNGNLRRVRKGLEGEVETLIVQHDGYDRPVRLTDPMGNLYTTRYDANGNKIALLVAGELEDVAGGDANVRLAEARWQYDAADRMTVRRELFFDPTTQQDLDDGESVTTQVYSPTSQVLGTQDDRGAETRVEYDRANRPALVTDAGGNTVRLEYDENSNVVRRTETDRSDLGGEDETFLTTRELDGLDRLVRTTDNAGNTDVFAYDSRGNLVRHVDGRDNVTRTELDGLDRTVRTVHVLTDSGEGSGSIVGEIVTRTVWDDSSRAVARTDDNGNVTRYEYDGLGRTVREVHPDGTDTTMIYDVHDNPVVAVDPNGTRVATAYDLLDRTERLQIEGAEGVLGSTFETFTYDGMSRLVSMVDDDSRVTRRHDSLSRVVAEAVGEDATVSSVFDGVGNRLELTYSGGRTLSMTYDLLRRVKTIREGESFIAQYAYRGGRRVERRLHGNGTSASFAYDDVRRMVGTTHAAGETVFDDRRYEWNEVDAKTAVDDVLEIGASRKLTYDSADRLVAVEETLGQGTRERAYDLDGVGNRLAVGGEAYELDSTVPEPADLQVNQYTATPFDERAHDRNGNLVEVRDALGERVMAYDYANRLVRHENEATGIVTEYAYDALGRRVGKIAGGAETRFLYDGLHVVEERGGAGATLATYVYGRGLDEVVQMRRGGEDFTFHADDLGNIIAASDSDGQVVERYAYGDFGALTVLGPAGAPRSATAIGNLYGFTGRRHDPESGLAYFRFRYLDPRAGRFTSRDPLGTWGDPANLGSGYTYAANDPWGRTDPLGLFVGETVVVVEVLSESALAAEVFAPLISEGLAATAGIVEAAALAAVAEVAAAGAAGVALGLAIDHFDLEFGLGGLALEALGLPGTAESFTDAFADQLFGDDDTVPDGEPVPEQGDPIEDGDADTDANSGADDDADTDADDCARRERQEESDGPEPPDQCDENGGTDDTCDQNRGGNDDECARYRGRSASGNGRNPQAAFASCRSQALSGVPSRCSRQMTCSETSRRNFGGSLGWSVSCTCN